MRESSDLYVVLSLCSENKNLIFAEVFNILLSQELYYENW
jgi:hypothetical protein